MELKQTRKISLGMKMRRYGKMFFFKFIFITFVRINFPRFFLFQQFYHSEGCRSVHDTFSRGLESNKKRLKISLTQNGFSEMRN